MVDGWRLEVWDSKVRVPSLPKPLASAQGSESALRKDCVVPRPIRVVFVKDIK